MSRKFWEYEEPDGSMSNFRVKWLIGSIVVGAAIFGALPAFFVSLSGYNIWLPAILGGSIAGAAGSLIAFAIDYREDIKQAKHHQQ